MAGGGGPHRPVAVSRFFLVYGAWACPTVGGRGDDSPRGSRVAVAFVTLSHGRPTRRGCHPSGGCRPWLAAAACVCGASCCPVLLPLQPVRGGASMGARAQPARRRTPGAGTGRRHLRAGVCTACRAGTAGTAGAGGRCAARGADAVGAAQGAAGAVVLPAASRRRRPRWPWRVGGGRCGWAGEADGAQAAASARSASHSSGGTSRSRALPLPRPHRPCSVVALERPSATRAVHPSPSALASAGAGAQIPAPATRAPTGFVLLSVGMYLFSG
eukprot:TRINITY_DN8526_c0_g1_i1.p2 TRINITY_DN8526_c0_g1~~TRINITY_DN8526_c0_g1_i1.p2  ORF type:complete len:272 (-),score=15.54 TRINITY_DN8526_c0_g1_i1:1111-1926(-)